MQIVESRFKIARVVVAMLRDISVATFWHSGREGYLSSRCQFLAFCVRFCMNLANFMRNKIIATALMFASVASTAGPIGSGGVLRVKRIPGTAYFSIVCKDGASVDIQRLRKDENLWYSFPPDEPFAFYKGTSPFAFAKAACNDAPMSQRKFRSIKRGVGSTASGALSYHIVCLDGREIDLMEYGGRGWESLIEVVPGIDALNRATPEHAANYACSTKWEN